jgi:hypothetical protein
MKPQTSTSTPIHFTLPFILFFTALPAQANQPISPAANASIDRALAYLKQTQQADGDWPHGSTAGTTAVPSLAVMAFLSRGHTPGQGPYGQTLNAAIDLVLRAQQLEGPKRGLLAHDDSNVVMYEHGIATVMLTEAYGMVDDARRSKIDRALSLALQLIIDAQSAEKTNPKDRGGWRYALNSPDSDISVTGWQLMALRGAANCGAAIPPDVLEKGAQYVARCASEKGGFAYQSDAGEPNVARTGTGLLSTLLITGNSASPQIQKAADYLKANPPDRSTPFYYYAIYYDSQALNQLGGTYWHTVYPKLVQNLLPLQQPDGSFAPAADGQESEAGPAYRTSMATLALTVPLRYLPLYQSEKH